MRRKPQRTRSKRRADSTEAIFESSSAKLKPGHGWRSRPGYGVFSFGRGDLMFETPTDWVILPGVKSVKFHDREPPDDQVTLEVSLIIVPPRDWSNLPLVPLMRGAGRFSGVEAPPESIIEVERIGLSYCWYEYTGIDEVEQRPAIYRTCFARDNAHHAIFSFAFWPEDRERFSPVWFAVLDSIQFGQRFKDPLIGPTLH